MSALAGVVAGLTFAAFTVRDDWLFRHAWDLQPNGVGLKSGVQVARYATPVPEDDARRVAQAALEEFDLNIPEDAARVEVDIVDFESEDEVWIEDATLVRVMLPTDQAVVMLTPDAPGSSSLPLVDYSTAGDLNDWVVDMMGAYVDLHVPAADLRPAGQTYLAIVAPAGDPAEVTFLAYDLETRM
ncbi:hypothetical protein [Cellulomonas pakistanensis]|uniref:hypothetical protein n=1 Tax=Cellulomonas pakistanensis TaxID=992287 RepID=UPI00194499E6|nr:hypothetical protein [Cellulomonas pakistanensis]